MPAVRAAASPVTALDSPDSWPTSQRTRRPEGREDSRDGEGETLPGRQGRRDHRRRPRDRQGDGDRARPGAGAGSRSATSTTELAEQTAQSLGGGAIALSLDVTERESFAEFLDETERQLGPARRADQQRRDHAAGTLRRRGRRDRAADDRHQPARRDLRHQAGPGADGAAQLAGTSSTSPPRRARAAFRAAPPTARPSTPWSASARPFGPSSTTPTSRSPCVMPAVVNTELASGPEGGARGQEPRARGRRRGDRRGAGDGPLRRLGAALDPVHRDGDEHRAPTRPRGDRPVAQGGQGPRRGRQAARAAYEDRAAHSEPGLEPDEEKVSAKSAD